jgi:hypothetical protein
VRHFFIRVYRGKQTLRTYVLAHDHHGVHSPESETDHRDLVGGHVISVDEEHVFVLVDVLLELNPVLLLLNTLFRLLLHCHSLLFGLIK